MDVASIGVLCLAGLCGGFTQGLAGFGSTLIALPILALVFDLKLAVPVGTTLALILNVVMVARLRRYIRFKTLFLLIAAALPGIPLGVYALGTLPEHWLKTVLALAILAFVGNQWRGSCDLTPAGRSWGVVAGFVSGCMSGAIGINGPPIVAWVCRLGLDRNTMRATLVAYFLLTGCAVVASQILAGLVTGAVVARTAVALPALFLGIAAGVGLCGRISETAFRRVVLFVLAATAVSLLLQGASGLLAG